MKSSKICHFSGERGSWDSTGQGEDRYFKVKFQAHLEFQCVTT